MDKTELEERKKFNQPFLRVFDYVKKTRKLTQGSLAQLIRCDSSLISMYRSGEKKVNEDMMLRLSRESIEPIYMSYMLGTSEYMLVKNVPDEEFSMNKEDPDYDVIMRDRQRNHFGDIMMKEPEHTQIPEWADSLIYTISQQIQKNEALTQELQDAIRSVNSLKNTLEIIIINYKKNAS